MFCIPYKTSFWNFVIKLKLCINLLGSHSMKIKCKAAQMLSCLKLVLYMIQNKTIDRKIIS